MTQRLCKICGKWHDLDADWPAECHAHYSPKGAPSGQIIKDIDPYRTVAADKETGKRANVGSRSEHREFLKRNGYIEVGNELNNAKPKPQQIQTVTGREIRQAIDQLRSRK